MNIQTKYLDSVEIENSRTIQFPAGIPGFIDETDFVLLDLPGNPTFQILQSITSEHTAFVVTNPYHFYEKYAFDLDDNLLASLLIESEEDVVVLTIVTLKSPFHMSTINLKAPIIINLVKKLGKQYILNTDDYSKQASLTMSHSSATKGV